MDKNAEVEIEKENLAITHPANLWKLNEETIQVEKVEELKHPEGLILQLGDQQPLGEQQQLEGPHEEQLEGLQQEELQLQGEQQQQGEQQPQGGQPQDHPAPKMKELNVLYAEVFFPLMLLIAPSLT